MLHRSFNVYMVIILNFVGSDQYVLCSYVYCPAHCNTKGEKRPAEWCEESLCCNMGGWLDCCNDNSKDVNGTIKDGWQCDKSGDHGPMVVLSTVLIWAAVALAILTLISIVIVFASQRIKRSRAERRGSDSSISCMSDCSISDSTPNPVDHIILDPLPSSPPPYSLIDSYPYQVRAAPSEDPPDYEEITQI